MPGIVIHDDIAQGPDTPIEDKRGLGGVIPFIKVVGAAAEAGKSLDEIVALANAFNDGIATLSVALKTATHPQNGGEIGSLADDEMEIGMGQHGEGGGGISKMCTADETVEKMLPPLVKATKLAAGDKALLLINGSGATTTMEMLICYRKAKQMLADADTAGKLAIDAACAKAEEELKELSRQVSEKARAQAKDLSGELENQKAALRARAEGRLEQAAALVVERIVNS